MTDKYYPFALDSSTKNDINHGITVVPQKEISPWRKSLFRSARINLGTISVEHMTGSIKLSNSNHLMHPFLPISLKFALSDTTIPLAWWPIGTYGRRLRTPEFILCFARRRIGVHLNVTDCWITTGVNTKSQIAKSQCSGDSGSG